MESEVNHYVALWLSSRGFLSKSSIGRLKRGQPLIRGRSRERVDTFLELALDSSRRTVGANLKGIVELLVGDGYLELNPYHEYKLTPVGREYYKRLGSELPTRGPLRDLRGF